MEQRVTIQGAEAHVRVFPDLEPLSHAAAAYCLAALETELEAGRERLSLVLAGGSSPRRLYELLGTTYRERVPWERLHLFWGDDRLVPRDHEHSNQGAAYRDFIDRVSIPPENVHPMPTTEPPEEAAAHYEQTLQAFFDGGPPAFDLVLLGLGGDGHTASLFPEHEPTRHVGDPEAPLVEAVPPPDAMKPAVGRLTLTLPALGHAKRILFLVAGASKQDAVEQILRSPDPMLPAAYAHAQDELAWYLTEDAWGEHSTGENVTG